MLSFAVHAQSVSDQGTTDDTVEQAKKLSNPVASLISVPLQFNYDSKIGPDERGYRLTMNLQPVIPISISDDWNMISRYRESVGAWKHHTKPVLLAQGAHIAWRDMGCRSSIPATDGYRRSARCQEVGAGADLRHAQTRQRVHVWFLDQSDMVHRQRKEQRRP
jgi:hypothetical protein